MVFGLSETFWLSLTAMFVVGAADMVSVNIRGLINTISDPGCDARQGERGKFNFHGCFK